MTVVQEAIRWMPKYREQEAIRLCLKHFRQKNYIEAFETLRKKTNISLEDELLTQLYDILVVRGEFDQSELLIADCVRNGLFDDYIRRQSCQPLWHELMMSSVEPKPAQRGGHQMCIDSHNEIIYLFGGFNGKNDLSDFWSFDLKTQKWKCLFADCSETGGPDARSCHKLCLDPKRKKIFTLGKYLNLTTRSTQKVKVNFDFLKFQFISS